MEGVKNLDTFREKKDVESSCSDDSDGDSYESQSLSGSEILEVLSQNGAVEDGEVVGADSSAEEGELEMKVEPKKRPKRNSLWSDVVTEQVLTSGLGQLNQKPITFEEFNKKFPVKSRKRRHKDVKAPSQPGSIPEKLKNYRDLDGGNDISLSSNQVSNCTGHVDFNALVKAVEKGRVETSNKEKPVSKPVARKPVMSRLGPVTRSQHQNQPQKQSSSTKRPSALSRLEIDQRVIVEESLSKEELVDALSRALGEKQSLDVLVNAVEVLGTARSVDFFKRTVAKEKNGGISIMDGSRRKTPGGVFFYLIKTSAHVTPDERTRIFGSNSDLKAKKKRRKHGNKKAKRRTTSSTNSIGSCESVSNYGDNSNSNSNSMPADMETVDTGLEK